MSDVPLPINVFADTLERVRAAARVAAPEATDASLSRIQVEPPREKGHGEVATNAAMVLAKDVRRNPLELAEAIAAHLRTDATVADAAVARPGFINLTLRPEVWIQELQRAVSAGRDYGRSPVGAETLINVEYVSANPTGPMHVGHGRGAVFGDALAGLLAFTGHDVTREYYVNDAGAQVDVLARSAFLRYREALGETIGAIPEGLYPGDYLKPVGVELAQEFGDALRKQSENEWLPIVRERGIAAVMAVVRTDLAALNITHEVFFSERSLVHGTIDQVGATIAWLRERGHVFEGRLPPPKGAPVEDWEDREQTLFRSTAFGDDVDRPLKKSDGSYTYFASDIAYHADKIRRGFHTLIDIWGADHGGYVKRMKAAVAALSDNKVELDIKLIQLVKLLRKNDAPLDFDLAKVLEQSRDNPVFYVQYGHARGHSVFRNAHEAFPGLPALADMVTAADLNLLSDPAELALIRQISLYPRVVEAAALSHEPHRIAFYLYDLASDFHALWTLGNASPHLRFIIPDDRELTMARLVLVQGVVTVLGSGLSLLGVGAPEEMR